MNLPHANRSTVTHAHTPRKHHGASEVTFNIFTLLLGSTLLYKRQQTTHVPLTEQQQNTKINFVVRATLSGGPWPVPNTIWAKKKIKKKRFCLVRALIKVFFDASREQRGSTGEGDVNEVDETYSVCFSSFVETEAKSIHRCRSDSPQSASP